MLVQILGEALKPDQESWLNLRRDRDLQRNMGSRLKLASQSKVG
jgi:hypothetical protein